MPIQANSLLAEIIGTTESDLKRLEFRKSKGIYLCTLGQDAFGWLGLNVATHRTDERIGINPVVGVRHKRIEEMVGGLLEEEEQAVAPTISTALGYLMPEGRYLEWLFEASPFDYHSECKRMVEAVEVYGMPFMHSNASLGTIVQDLDQLRYSSKDTAVYRFPVANLLTGKTDLAVAYVKKHLEALGDRKDLGAQQYRRFASNFSKHGSLNK